MWCNLDPEGEEMSTISTTHVDMIITVAGVEREVEAEVKYIYCRAYGATYDRMGGPISPPEPETAEIQSITITADDRADLKQYDICHFLSEKQMDAIVEEILYDR